MKIFLFYTVNITLFVSLLAGCYNDTEEELYRFTQTNCDTTNVTYSKNIATIMQVECNVCHSSSSPSGGCTTDNYTGLYTIALNGKLFGTTNYLSGFSAMPKGANKLNDCKLTQIKKWIDAGSLNN
jgi:hypothetical protein